MTSSQPIVYPPVVRSDDPLTCGNCGEELRCATSGKVGCANSLVNARYAVAGGRWRARCPKPRDISQILAENALLRVMVLRGPALPQGLAQRPPAEQDAWFAETFAQVTKEIVSGKRL